MALVKRAFLCWIGLLASACTLTLIPPRPPSSLWGPVITLGQAEQTQAPALVVEPARISASWIGADETGVHQDILHVIGGAVSPRVVLPLPPRHPYAQQLAPGLEDTVHLFWLDADENNEPRLYAALVSPELQVMRGSTPVSNEHTLHYVVAANGDGSLWAVWSGGVVAEPALYASYLDSTGLPFPPQPLVHEAAWPALARSNDGILHLFWLNTKELKVYHALLADGKLRDIALLGAAPHLEPGDRLVEMRAGLDTARAYLLWNVTRADGAPESWIVSGTLNAGEWGEPVRLGAVPTSKSGFVTGFNTGMARPAQASDSWLSWASLMPGQFDVLTLAAQTQNQLVVLYFQAGEVVGYQEIVTVGALLGAPTLVTDRDRHLYLAWAEPSPQGFANLKLTMTRPV